jgi:O-antigen/teichoic acid export membrane protein
MVANAPVQRALVALGRPGTLFLFDLASFGVLFVAAVVGAREWGLVGVALAVAAHKAVQLAWSTWLVRTIALQRHRDMESPT